MYLIFLSIGHSVLKNSILKAILSKKTIGAAFEISTSVTLNNQFKTNQTNIKKTKKYEL